MFSSDFNLIMKKTWNIKKHLLKKSLYFAALAFELYFALGRKTLAIAVIFTIKKDPIQFITIDSKSFSESIK